MLTPNCAMFSFLSTETALKKLVASTTAATPGVWNNHRNDL